MIFIQILKAKQLKTGLETVNNDDLEPKLLW